MSLKPKTKIIIKRKLVQYSLTESHDKKNNIRN